MITSSDHGNDLRSWWGLHEVPRSKKTPKHSNLLGQEQNLGPKKFTLGSKSKICG